MDMTPQQIDELLDRIRDERGDAIDPARITDLLEADDLADTAADVLELADVDHDIADAEFRAARETLNQAITRRDSAEREHQARHAAVVEMRRQLGVMRTATGYKTIRQARADADAARAATANSFVRDQARLAAKAADPNRTDWLPTDLGDDPGGDNSAYPYA